MKKVFPLIHLRDEQKKQLEAITFLTMLFFVLGAHWYGVRKASILVGKVNQQALHVDRTLDLVKYYNLFKRPDVFEVTDIFLSSDKQNEKYRSVYLTQSQEVVDFAEKTKRKYEKTYLSEVPEELILFDLFVHETRNHFSITKSGSDINPDIQKKIKDYDSSQPTYIMKIDKYDFDVVDDILSVPNIGSLESREVSKILEFGSAVKVFIFTLIIVLALSCCHFFRLIYSTGDACFRSPYGNILITAGIFLFALFYENSGTYNQYSTYEIILNLSAGGTTLYLAILTLTKE